MERIRLILILGILITFCLQIHSQETFKPTSATITDKDGSFTSDSFDCPNMIIYDYKSNITVATGGSKITLKKDTYNNDIYIAKIKHNNQFMVITAFRSSNTQRIYLVTLSSKEGEKAIVIDYKPL